MTDKTTSITPSTVVLKMAAPVAKAPYPHHVQQLQQQYVPRRPSPLAMFTSSGGEDEDENMDSQAYKGREALQYDAQRNSIHLVPKNRSHNHNSNDESHDGDPSIITSPLVLRKAYSISNNDLADENVSGRKLEMPPSSPMSYGSVIASEYSSDSDRDYDLGGNLDVVNNEDSRSTSISNLSNMSTLNGLVISTDEGEYDEDDDESEKHPAPLFVHGEHVLLFDSECMKDLTIKYGITGQLSGTLPLAPQQNSLLGFPWRLSLYEVLWCLHEGVGVLVDGEEVVKNGYLKEFIEDERKRRVILDDLQDRLDRWRDEKQREIEEQMKKLNIIKKDKRAMKPLENVLVSSASMPDLQQVLNEKERKEKGIEEAKQKSREMHEKSKKNQIVFMETPTDDSRISFLWEGLMKKYYDRKNPQFGLLRKLINHEVRHMHYEDRQWCYNKIWLNFVMYKYLKSQLGYYLLPGMRFGGVFVSYPGDPLRYHAQQIIDTREYYEEDIGLFKICNRGRLATGVRKVWIVGGTVDNSGTDRDIVERLLFDSGNKNNYDTGRIRCFSIEWAGF